jgi:NADH-quinone oxidoreductase subunit L
MIQSSIVHFLAPEGPRWDVWMIPLLPVFGFLFQVFIGTRLPKMVVSIVSCGAVLASAILAWTLFFELKGIADPEQRKIVADLAPWIDVPGLKDGFLAVVARHRLVVDPLTSVMILVITNIGFLIHVYSTGYMAEEKRYARYFSYLNLFTGFMLILVMASNLILMFVGWEGVGLCSYLLIGFWYEKKENAAAGMKAFVVNRVGDLAFTVGALMLFVTLGRATGVWTVDFTELKGLIEKHPKALEGVAFAIGLLLFIGATGKSAQVPLYTWLPDAMAGPTPVSALIHAATMVTAGVYMIARMNFLYTLTPGAMTVVTLTGAFTALFAGSIGVAQNDIKKVLAYSTVSQLGFMFMGVGVGAFAAGIFHLFTHAFFKACLFLGSGSVIHGMGHEQDIRKMGGLRSKMPWTFATFGLATLAIAGIPPFAGFFSKDEILWQAFSTHALVGPAGKIAWLLGFAAAACTAFYMTRLVVMTFLGRPQWAQASAFSGGGAGHGHGEDEHASQLPDDASLLDMGPLKGHGAHDEHASHGGGHDAGHDAAHGHGHAGEPHESPVSMVGVLVVLAACSVVVGFLGVPPILGGKDSNLFEHWLLPVLPAPAHEGASHLMEWILMFGSVAIAVGGIAAGLWVYLKRGGVPARNYAEKHPEQYELVLNKYKVDEAYDSMVVQPLLNLNETAGRFDNEVVDGAVNGAAAVTKAASRGVGVVDNEVVDAGVNAAADVTQAIGARARRLQTGNIRDYLTFALVGGLFAIAAYCVKIAWPQIAESLGRMFGS